MEIAAKLATELALSSLSPLINKLLINKLASKFGGDVTDEEIEHLNVFVRYEIVALTREANSDDLVQLMPLLEKLQAAALEVEDLLDLYEYKQIQKQVSSSSSNPIKKFKPKFKEMLGPILPKSDLRNCLEKVLEFVEQVEKIHPFITSRTNTTQAQAIPVTPTTSTLLSPYFGRDNQCDSIIDFLLDESHAGSSKRTNKVPVIAIIGMGGCGKSHTAQRICNDDRIKNHFGANMWVHVTRDFDVVGLTRKIVESANNGKCPQITNLDVLQKKLIKSLSNQKKFLLVLDDVWCEEKMKWDLLVGPLNEVARNGSKIIITTRIDNIADNLHANKFPLEDLKAEECWSILKHYAFNNYEEIVDDEELINVGNQIISKAKHSPLALKVVGSSLRNKRSVKEWEDILKQDILKETMDLLLFSYQCLPLHLQRCFAYCSLFPKGYRFKLEVNADSPHLISLWIAQGFIENRGELTLEEAGKKYIEELQSYSFFEKRYDDDGEYDHFVIHDLLHDLAEKVSKKQCHRIEHYDSDLDIPETCVHLSLYRTEKLSSLAISNLLNLRGLRTLIVFMVGGPTTIFKNKRDVFQNLTRLRALYVNHHQQMEVLSNPCIDKLKRLRYLHVRYDSKLPVSLTKLYHLQFLILITELEESLFEGSNWCLPANTMPHGFSNLINLRTIKFYHEGFYYTMELDYLHYNSVMIEKLTSLQNLKNFHLNGFNGMISLRNLPLCGSLSISNLENVRCKEEAEMAMLNQKKNLNELIFKWNSSPSRIDTPEEVLEGLEPDRNLEKLEISCYEGVTVPNWMVRLPRLQSLKLESCRNLKIIPFLPRLQELTIEDCPNLTLPSMFDLSVLTNLERLCLREFPNLQALANLSHAVTYLRIEDCPIITSLGNLQRCTSLKELIIYKCPMLRREEASLVEGDIANCLTHVECIEIDEPLLVFELVQQQAFSSIKSLNLTDCAAATIPNLEKLSSLVYFEIINCPDVESLSNLPVSLQELRIRSCPKMKMKYEEDGPLHLDLKDCATVSILNLEKLSSLEKLSIWDCPNVESLPNLPISLQWLETIRCPKLKMKYEEGGPLHVDLKDCAATAISNLEKLSSLEILRIVDCPDVESLSNLPVSLQELCIESCAKMKMKYEEGGPLQLDLKAAAIPNLEKLSSLFNFRIKDCPDVELLPNLPVYLQKLYIDGCPKLKMKYEEGGPLHSSISHIPSINIY